MAFFFFELALARIGLRFRRGPFVFHFHGRRQPCPACPDLLRRESGSLVAQATASDRFRSRLNFRRCAVLVTGVVRAGRRVTVMLSDGRSLTEQEPYLRIERTYVESPLGVRYSFARPQPKPPAPVVDPRNVDPKKEPEVKAADYKGEALFPPSEGFGTFATPPNPANASGGVSAGGVRGRR